MINIKTRNISLMLFGLVLFFSDNSKSNDFPTLARSEFVFACMSSNASNRDFMAKCSCAIDEISKRISYEEYAQAEAIARLWEGASPREEAFKSVGLSKEKMDKLFRAQAASELECF
jgi:hypothetical protein